MKKIFMFFLFLILLTGCGGGATIPAYQQQGYSVKVIYNFGEGTWRGNHTADFQYKPGTPVAQIGIDFAKGETPELTNHSIEGWYLDEDYTIPFDFSTYLVEEGNDITIYAKWVVNTKYIYKVVTIENGQEIDLMEIKTSPGAVLEKILVKRTGFLLLDCYQDENCTILWDDSYTMREAEDGEDNVIVKVYTKWISDSLAKVSTVEEFNKAIARGKGIYLMNDLDFAGKEFRYMSSYDNEIIGNNFKLSNIKIETIKVLSSERIPQFGLFGTLSGATIKNVTFENVELVVETKVQVEIYVGTLAGTIKDSTIENVNISGKITISSIQDKINRLEYNNEDLANTIENSTINNCVVNFVVEDLR